MPRRPLWPGFVLNTFFYATTLWLVISGPLALRRLHRIRRGFCTACGYNLAHATHEICPERGS